MPPVTTNQVRELARDLVLKHPEGIRFAEIVAEIMRTFPEADKTMVQAQIATRLLLTYPSEITRPSRGLFKPIAANGPVPKAGLGAVATQPPEVPSPPITPGVEVEKMAKLQTLQLILQIIGGAVAIIATVIGAYFATKK